MASIGPYSSFEPPTGRPSRGRHRAPDPDDAPPGGPQPTSTGYPEDHTPAEPVRPVGGTHDPGGLPASPPAADDRTREHAPVRDRAAPEDPAPTPTTATGKSRAGRNLPAAIGVGVGLGAVVVASLFLWRPAFLIVLAAGVVVGTWEMVRALGRASDPAKRARPPLVPLLVGALAMEVLAWFGGLEALTVGLVFTVTAVLIWRLADGPAGYRRDVAAATLVAGYVPFLAGFGVLLARPDDGAWRMVLVLAMVVCSDTGGYAVGVLLGRHRMAPAVSPGKSWEGFGGSVAVCAVAGVLLLHFGLHSPWWYGAVLGVAVSLVSVLGDLAESLLKRDLGIKDMGHLLPGHGGVMDRLDSILFAVPVSFALLSVLVPPTG